MKKLLQFLRGFVLLIARVGLGAVLIGHAWQRWHQGITTQAAFFESFGLPQGRVVAWGAITVEAVCGIMLIVGFITPLFALIALVEQVLLVAYTSWFQGWQLAAPNNTDYRGGWEYSVILGLLAAVFVVYGGGPAALDRLFRRTKDTEAAEDGYDSSSAKSVTYAA